MDKQEMATEVKKILREEKTKLNGKDKADILDCVPKILEAVSIDQNYLLACIRKLVRDSQSNPLNAFFRIFGLSVINESRLEVTDVSKLDKMLGLNQEALHRAVARMAEYLENLENDIDQKVSSKNSEYNKVCRKLEQERGEKSRLQAENAEQRLAVAQRIQPILGKEGTVFADSPLKGQINELLEDFGIKAYWDAEGAPLSFAAMFTELKVDDAESRKRTPCMMYGDKVLAKGVCYIAE